MVDVVVFGASGAVGSAFINYLRRENVSVHPWNRALDPLDDEASVAFRLRHLKPSFVYNFAVASGDESTQVNVDFAVRLSRLSTQLAYRLIHTSSVMVFTDECPGPLTPETRPNATQGYGLEKRLAEEGITAVNANNVIVRLGWQIGESAGSNNMIDFLEAAAGKGPIRASRLWYPSCSFLHQTAPFLWEARHLAGSIYNWNANAKYSFHEIVQELRVRLQRTDWQVEVDDAYCQNQLMQDPRLVVPDLFENNHPAPQSRVVLRTSD